MTCTLDWARDSLRYKFFVRESNQHQAKMELRTYMWLVGKYTKEGDTILDPMSGTGTVHLANYAGRRTVGVEIMPEFVELQEKNILFMEDVFNNKKNLYKQFGIEPTLPKRHIILPGDCRRVLPLDYEVDAVIFSPPYGSLWKQSKAPQSQVNAEKNYNVGYGESDANIGNYNVYPKYLQAMRIVYEKCYQSLKPGGILVTVVKDYVTGGRRVPCSRDNLLQCVKAGFTFEDWHFRTTKIASPFSVKARKQREAKGNKRIDLNIGYEDIIVVKKET